MGRAAVPERTKAPLSRTVFAGHSSGSHLVPAKICYLLIIIIQRISTSKLTQITNPLENDFGTRARSF